MAKAKGPNAPTSKPKPNATSRRPVCPKCGNPARRVYAQIVSPKTGLSTSVTMPAVYCGAPEQAIVEDHVVYRFDASSGDGLVPLPRSELSSFAKALVTSQKAAVLRHKNAKSEAVEEGRRAKPLSWTGAKAALAAIEREKAKAEAAAKQAADEKAEAKAEKDAKRAAAKAKKAATKAKAAKGKKGKTPSRKPKAEEPDEDEDDEE